MMRFATQRVRAFSFHNFAKENTVKALLSPRGAFLISGPKRGGLIREGGLIKQIPLKIVCVIVKKKKESNRLFHGLHSYRKRCHKMLKTWQWNLSPAVRGSTSVFNIWRRPTNVARSCLLNKSTTFFHGLHSQALFTRVRTNFCTDKNLHGSTLRSHGTGGTGRIF